MKSATLGYPCIGHQRELPLIVEKHIRKEASEEDVLFTERMIQQENWIFQHQLGIDYIPSNDGTLFCRMLDMAVLLGVTPKRFDFLNGLERYFAMANGYGSVAPLRVTRWFNTQRFFVVPIYEGRTKLKLTRLLDQYLAAKEIGLPTRPVIIGPVTFAALCDGDATPYDFIPVYEELFAAFAEHDISAVQIDEPVLSSLCSDTVIQAAKDVYEAVQNDQVHQTIAVFYGAPHAALFEFPVDGIHIDCVQGYFSHHHWETEKELSLGIIAGNNVWRTQTINSTLMAVADVVAPSSPLYHLPISTHREFCIEKPMLAFAEERVHELKRIKEDRFKNKFYKFPTNESVQKRISELTFLDFSHAPHPIDLPDYATSGGGSFPTSTRVETIYEANLIGLVDDRDFASVIELEISNCIEIQEEAGLDIISYGEFERINQVASLAKSLGNVVTTRFGWVQKLGTYLERPPIIKGDVKLLNPVSTEFIRFAKSKTNRPLLATIPGPITFAKECFVRDDILMADVCEQIALAFNDIVRDWDAAGLDCLRIDEPFMNQDASLLRDEKFAFWVKDVISLLMGKTKLYAMLNAGLLEHELAEDLLENTTFNTVLQSPQLSKIDLTGFPSVAFCINERMKLSEENAAKIFREVKAHAVNHAWLLPTGSVRHLSVTRCKALYDVLVGTADKLRKE